MQTKCRGCYRGVQMPPMPPVLSMPGMPGMPGMTGMPPCSPYGPPAHTPLPGWAMHLRSTGLTGAPGAQGIIAQGMTMHPPHARGDHPRAAQFRCGPGAFAPRTWAASGDHRASSTPGPPRVTRVLVPQFRPTRPHPIRPHPAQSDDDALGPSTRRRQADTPARPKSNPERW